MQNCKNATCNINVMIRNTKYIMSIARFMLIDEKHAIMQIAQINFRFVFDFQFRFLDTLDIVFSHLKLIIRISQEFHTQLFS